MRNQTVLEKRNKAKADRPKKNLQYQHLAEGCAAEHVWKWWYMAACSDKAANKYDISYTFLPIFFA